MLCPDFEGFHASAMYKSRPIAYHPPSGCFSGRRTHSGEWEGMNDPPPSRERSEEDRGRGMGIQNWPYACRLVSGALLLAALALVSSPPARAAEDVRGATPQRGRALVFVFRIDRQPQAAQVPVLVNAELVGELANGTFVAASVDPGTTFLRIGERVLSTLSFVAAANQRYYVWVDAITGLPLVRTEVSLVGEADGQRALAQSRFVGVTPPAPPAAAPRVDRAAPAAPAPQPAPARDAAAPQPTPERAAVALGEPEKDWRFALIASAGSFKLADETQTVAGLASTYDTTSKSVFGIEAELRGKSGFAAGVEIFSYKNDLVTSGAIPNAQQKVRALMLNGKYYFHAADWLYPFLGVGVGQARASYSGGLAGDTTGLAYQGMAGMEFRFNSVGLLVQYRHLSSKTGDDGSEVKVGGGGFLAGLSIAF
jgi:opacity protein-like surface antigen